MSPATGYAIQTLVTVVAICALAVMVLYAARRFGVGRPSGPLELVGRLPLDARRAIYVVRIAERIYVLGASEAGLNKLGELGGDEFGRASVPTVPAFREVLRRVAGRAWIPQEKLPQADRSAVCDKPPLEDQASTAGTGPGSEQQER